jgi:hypothetical protein
LRADGDQDVQPGTHAGVQELRRARGQAAQLGQVRQPAGRSVDLRMLTAAMKTLTLTCANVATPQQS